MTTYLRAFTEAQLRALQSVLQPIVTNGYAAPEDVLGGKAALSRPVDGEALCMPIVCNGWERRAAALELPKKGAKREADREAYMQGALAALLACGLMTVERTNQLAFMTAVGRLGDYVAEQAVKGASDEEPLADPGTTRLHL